MATEPPQNQRSLAARAKERLEQLDELDLHAPGAPTELRFFNDLLRVIKHERQIQGQRSAKRWHRGIIVIWILLLASIGVASLVPIGQLRVDGVVDARAVSFTTIEPSSHTPAGSVAALELAGALRIEPLGSGQASTAEHVRVSSASGGSVTLQRVEIPAGTYVDLRREIQDGTYSVTTVPSRSADDLLLEISVVGPASIQVDGDENGVGRGIVSGVSVSGTARTDWWLHLSGVNPRLRLYDISTDGMSFVETALRPTSSTRSEEVLTTVEGGVLWLTGLDGRVVEMRPGTTMRAEFTDMAARRLEAAETLNVIFEGNASSLELGSSNRVRSLRPSYLEWILTRPGLNLLWISVIGLAGAITAFAWLRAP